MGRLLVDVTQMFFRLGSGSQVAPLLRQVRTEFLPALEKVLDTTTRAFGPAFLNAITQATILFSKLVGDNGPLVLFAELVGHILEGINKLIDRVPALGT